MSRVAISIEPEENSTAPSPDSKFEHLRSHFSSPALEKVSDLRFVRHGLSETLALRGRRPAQQIADVDISYHICKRLIDLVISVTALVLLSPIMFAAAIAVWMHDGGPLFFVQNRVGKGGKRFRCFKFRSMIMNAESLQNGLTMQNEHSDHRTFKMADDPRITPPGRILRRFSIDELPQLVNVVRGEMSLVGPRPPLPAEVALYSDSDYQRLSVKPGLTCIWQVSGRSRLAFPEQVKMDLEYIRSRSMKNDTAILLRTIPAVLSGDGAS